jgi:DNA-binding transcriptional LysR family regulator
MFVETIRAGSFARAARRLSIPANTLSRRVRRLEAALHTRLMQRSTRKLTLTSAGQAFFDHCVPALETVLQAGRELIDGSQGPCGSVRVAAPAGFLELFRTEWVAEFLAAHPRVRLDFVLDDARADLIAEHIDVAFRAGGVHNPAFARRQIFTNLTSLVASPGYLASRGMPPTARALALHDCLTFGGRQGRMIWRLQGPGGSEEVEVTGRFSANEARALLQACVAGLGVALLPAVITAPHVACGQLLPVLPEYRREGGGFHVVFPSRQQIPPAAAALAQFVEARLRAMAAVQPAKRPPARRRLRAGRTRAVI